MQVRRSGGTDRILVSGKGELLTYDGLRQEIYQISKKAGIKFSANRGRRFYAVFIYKQGLDLEELRLLMRR